MLLPMELRMVESAFPRTWVSPDGQVIDLDEADRSHSLFVVENPELFGIDPDQIQSLVKRWEEEDLDFDFDYVIALASSKGWVRTSRDEAQSGAVSSGDIRAVRKEAKRLLANGHGEEGLTIMVEVIDGGMIRQNTWILGPDRLELFCRFGNPGIPESHELPHNGVCNPKVQEGLILAL